MEWVVQAQIATTGSSSVECNMRGAFKQQVTRPRVSLIPRQPLRNFAVQARLKDVLRAVKDTPAAGQTGSKVTSPSTHREYSETLVKLAARGEAVEYVDAVRKTSLYSSEQINADHRPASAARAEKALVDRNMQQSTELLQKNRRNEVPEHEIVGQMLDTGSKHWGERVRTIAV